MLNKALSYHRLLLMTLGLTYINWVMPIPALCCAFVFLPMTLANRTQPEVQTDQHAKP